MKLTEKDVLLIESSRRLARMFQYADFSENEDWKRAEEYLVGTLVATNNLDLIREQLVLREELAIDLFREEMSV